MPTLSNWLSQQLWRLFGGSRKDAFARALQETIATLRQMPFAEAREQVFEAIASGHLAATDRTDETAPSSLLALLPPSVSDLLGTYSDVRADLFSIGYAHLEAGGEQPGWVKVGEEVIEGVPLVVRPGHDTLYVADPECTLEPSDPWAHSSIWHYLLYQLQAPRWESFHPPHTGAHPAPPNKRMDQSWRG